jgi:dipeptidyl aminopeptidase/acylaminoacyl peptidase
MLERSEARFRAIEIGLPSWADAEPDRLAFVSNETGVWQVWTLDLTTGRRDRITGKPFGVARVLVSPDGKIVWWSDTKGDEWGRWMFTRFDGGDPTPLVPDADEAWSSGFSLTRGRVAFGRATEEDYAIYVVDDGQAPRLLYRHESVAGVGRLLPEGTGGISADGSLVCIRHSEQGDVIHPALRVLDATSGEQVAELIDPGRALSPVAWAPSEPLLLFTSERGDFERPAIWDPSRNERRDLDVDLPGAAIPLAWYPDGDAIVVRQEHEAIDRLHRVDIHTGETRLVADPGGEIEEAVVRPDDEVWLTVGNASHPRRPETGDGHPLVPMPNDAPPGRPFRSFWFSNSAKDRIQAVVVAPPGSGPFPIVIRAHGGPEWHERERWDPEVQALVDAGYVVAGVNFRGSTGYGIAFRERLTENPLLADSEDLVACLDALIEDGLADGGQAFLFGWSWGGILACLGEGLYPDRWRAVFAGVPVGDLVEGHRVAMPLIRALNVLTFGGDPTQVPERYRERNPMTYVDGAQAPVLVISAENDPRCPPAGVTPWVDALRRRGVEVELHVDPGGHWLNAMDAGVRDTDRILSFFERHRA